MRIRVSTVPPLPLAKVWSSLSSLSSVATVSNLKHLLCLQVPTLRGLRGDQIQLFVDDFELLDALAVDVVHENDLVYVKRIDSSTPTPVLRKRKRSESTTSLSSSLSSSASSSLSSSSSSSPSSSSNSSSDHRSATGFSLDSGPSPTKCRKLKPRNEQRPPNQRPFVPPGLGKPTTHSRNIRRRRKVQYARSVATLDPGDPIVGVNAIPLGDHNRTEATEIIPQTAVGSHGEFADLTMASLSNKNKRKGFKNAMGKEVRSKIVFSEQVDSNANGGVRASAPRLVPPSEKQEKGLLPQNVFVTSVDVEEGLGPSKKSRSDISNTTKRFESPPVGRTAGEIDRAVIEAKWDSLELVSSVTGLSTGTIAGWKALGINPVTITPEVMLHVGTVVSRDKNQVTVKLSDWSGFSAGTGEEVEEIEESHEWKEIVDQWRIVSVR